MSRFLVQATWDDSPHLSEAIKAEMFVALPPHQRDARSRGIPQLGSGAIYPVEESTILVDPFAIPDHWPRCYALDVGWNRTAALWIAQDRDSGRMFGYDEHYFAHSEPSENARAIKARGEWIPGVVDPAARGRSQNDGQKLITQYRDLGLKIVPADNAVEAGIYMVWTLFISGQLKIFKSCSNLMRELRFYRRDEKGRIVKENDHLCDALRYGCMSGRDRMVVKPPVKPWAPEGSGRSSWAA